MPRVAKGHVEQLPSGSFRVSVYAGTDPLTRRADPPQGHRQDRAAGAHRARQAAQGSLRGPHPRVRRDRGEAAGRVRGDRAMGRVHAADQRGIHPPHHQARPRAPGGAEGARPHPRQAVRGAEALRRPVLHRQAVHRAPQRPGSGDQPARPPPGLAAGHRDADRGHPVRDPRPGRRAAVDHRAERPAGHRDRRHPARPGGARRGRPDPRRGAARPRSWPGTAAAARPARGGGPGPATTAAAPDAGRTSATR